MGVGKGYFYGFLRPPNAIIKKMRKIIHLDLDAFFCSVEELLDPSLVGKAFAVGGRPGQRGVIASCSYAARQKGVRSAMPTGNALRLCPGLILVGGSHSLYGERSREVMAILEKWSGLIEQVSIDEAFLDVSDLREEGGIIAEKIQQEVKKKTGLPCSLGIATSKLVAKIATDYGKAQHRGITPPCAITEVPAGGEAQFLAPLLVDALWGVGPKTRAVLEEWGIKTIGDLANQDELEFCHRFGNFGRDLIQRARGIDISPVSAEHEVKSVSQEVTFEKDVLDRHDLEKTIRKLSEKVGRRLRADGWMGRIVRIKLRWPDFTTITRQVALRQAVDQDLMITDAAIRLFEKEWMPGKAVRLIGVGVSGLVHETRQLTLWDTRSEKERRLMEAMDEIHARFGRQAVHRGAEPEIKPKKKIESTGD
jgi:DNA polymerase IV